MSCFIEWLSLDPDSKRMLDDKMTILAHHETNIENKSVLIIQQAVNEDPALFKESWAQFTAVVYAISERIVGFDTRLGNISYFTSG